jgi:hypothetical protein
LPHHQLRNIKAAYEEATASVYRMYEQPADEPSVRDDMVRELSAPIDEGLRKEQMRRLIELAVMTNAAVDALKAAHTPSRRRRNLAPKATAVLRSWWEENRGDPYPSDQQKRDLAVKAGIEVQQVSNWFSNTRNRCY